MAESRADFQEFLEQDLARIKGVYHPIKAPLIERVVMAKVNVNRLHPNPDDEFCIKEVGPSYRIIGEYEEKFRHHIKRRLDPFDGDPLIVEKIRPDGYMLLNGHHRWAAARSVGFKRVPVKIVNLTHEDDVRNMLKASNAQKRVTLDLDEVIFLTHLDMFEPEPGVMPKPFKERVRIGVPALFHYLYTHGYDIWVFSSNYYSIDYIRRLFKRYGVHVDGIVTGTGKNKSKKNIDALLAEKYTETVNIDNESVVRIIRGSKDFDQFDIENQGKEWATDVRAIMEKIIDN